MLEIRYGQCKIMLNVFYNAVHLMSHVPCGPLLEKDHPCMIHIMILLVFCPFIDLLHSSTYPPCSLVGYFSTLPSTKWNNHLHLLPSVKWNILPPSPLTKWDNLLHKYFFFQIKHCVHLRWNCPELTSSIFTK